MKDNSIALLTYQEVLLGKRPGKSMQLENADAYSGVGEDLIRFAIEVVLGWTPKEAADHLNEHVAKKLYFNGILSRGVVREEDKTAFIRRQGSGKINMTAVDYRRMVNICYPDDKSVYYSVEEQRENIYRQSRERERLRAQGANVQDPRLPRDFIPRGLNVAELNEALATKVRDITVVDIIPRIRAEGISRNGLVYDIYEFWATAAKINPLLKEIGLISVLRDRMKNIGANNFYELFTRYVDLLGIENPAYTKAFAVYAAARNR